MVRRIRSINTMAGSRSYVVVVVSDMEHYPEVTSALGVDKKEVCYVYSAGTKKNGTSKLMIYTFNI